jgi:hypothetical protein
VITAVVRLKVISGDSTRRLGGVVAKKGVVYTLDEKRIKLRNLLTAYPETELGGAGGVLGKETCGVSSNRGNTRIFNPDVTHEVTLGANRDGNFIVRTEGTDVVHPLGFHSEIGVTLIILSKKRHLGLTSDIDVLGSDRHELD